MADDKGACIKSEAKHVSLVEIFDDMSSENLPTQEPITRSLHMCCTLESTLSDEELFLEQAFPRKYIVSENVRILHAFRHCCQRVLQSTKKHM